MTKGEKLLRDMLKVKFNHEKSEIEFKNKESEIYKKTIFSGSSNSNKPLIELVNLEEWRMDQVQEIPPFYSSYIGLRINPSDSAVSIRGMDNIIRLRDWLNDMLGDAVIQEMKDIRKRRK